MKRFFALAILFLATAVSLFSQQTIFERRDVLSPDIQADGTVIFRYYAPAASAVSIEGEFLSEPQPLQRDEAGLWVYRTTTPVAPEFYNYRFIVDGTKAIDPNNVFVNRDIATLTSVLLVPGAHADLYCVQDVPHGTVSKVWYDSPVAGFHRRLTVYTPAGYETSRGRRYPVLYVLHGVGGDEDAWVTQGRATQILDNLIASGKAEPMIVVFTNGNISQQAAPLENSTGYVRPHAWLPKTMDGTFETSFPEIVKFVDSRYRTIAKKSSRAICGLSMGGFHTMTLSLNYPKMFDYSGMFSAAINRGSEGVQMYADLDAKLDAYFAAKPRLLWIGCGSSDFLYRDNEEFRSKLDARGYPYTYVETDGGHIWRNWRLYLSEFVTLIFK